MLIMMLRTLYDRCVCVCECKCISTRINVLVGICCRHIAEIASLRYHLNLCTNPLHQKRNICYFLFSISFFFTLPHFLFVFYRMHLNQTYVQTLQTSITMFVEALLFLRLNAALTNFDMKLSRIRNIDRYDLKDKQISFSFVAFRWFLWMARMCAGGGARGFDWYCATFVFHIPLAMSNSITYVNACKTVYD